MVEFFRPCGGAIPVRRAVPAAANAIYRLTSLDNSDYLPLSKPQLFQTGRFQRWVRPGFCR